jgi:hypothetical protein
MNQRRSITVTSDGVQNRFAGDWHLHTLLVTGTYFISVSDPSVPSGRSVAWQERVEHGRRAGVEIVIEESDS